VTLAYTSFRPKTPRTGASGLSAIEAVALIDEAGGELALP
jgi:hypothetical protein